MARIIDSRSSLEKTVKIFDDFYAFSLVVDANQYDLVYSYFKSICSNTVIAGNFAVYLFRISQQTGINTMDLLSSFNGLDKIEINKVLAYYLNSFKSKTALYGIGQTLTPNQPVARNIIQ